MFWMPGCMTVRTELPWPGMWTATCEWTSHWLLLLWMACFVRRITPFYWRQEEVALGSMALKWRSRLTVLRL